MKSFLIAVGFLTKLPVPKKLAIEDKDLSGSMAYFPLAGFLLGLMLILVNALLAPFLPARMVNLILVLFLILITGGIHLDGFADTLAQNRLIMRKRRQSRFGPPGKAVKVA